MEVRSSSSAVIAPPVAPRRGEPWALGTVLGYASANIFDDLAVKLTNRPEALKPAPPQPISLVLTDALSGALVGTALRGLPSLALGIILIWKHRTLGQLRPSSAQYIGLRPILAFVAAGLISTFGLFLYYLALSFGGVTITIPVQETYVIWGTLIAWIFLHERLHRYAVAGVVLIFLGLVGLSFGQFRGQPISPHWYWAIPLGFTTALTYGVSGVLWRDGQLRGAHQSVAIFLQFVTSVSVAFVALVVAGRFPTSHAAPWRALAALLASGVLSGVLAIYCMFTALRLMAVARVYAFSSLTPLVATLFAHFFLHEFLNWLMLGGIVLVSIGVILTQVFRPKEEQQA
jgi:drug/metabolite transporter (DMT)-like permease